MIPLLWFVRNTKLWICMEYCGGGSLQDMYHGMYHLQMYFDIIASSFVMYHILL